QYRLTPGFGGFTPVSYVTTEYRLPCPDGHLKPRSDTLETVKGGGLGNGNFCTLSALFNQFKILTY
ncbi:hypothetical protein LDK77_24360, partial [Escherichia coli]|nr:hypothetical protein [Escherichia coli]